MCRSRIVRRGWPLCMPVTGRSWQQTQYRVCCAGCTRKATYRPDFTKIASLQTFCLSAPRHDDEAGSPNKNLRWITSSSQKFSFQMSMPLPVMKNKSLIAVPRK
uniref:Uncharacterized protein n=1 Tax=Anopheles atroparvus TaxID=41427 RepID=A0AAG5DW54_ANOAO